MKMMCFALFSLLFVFGTVHSEPVAVEWGSCQSTVGLGKRNEAPTLQDVVNKATFSSYFPNEELFPNHDKREVRNNTKLKILCG